MNAKPGDWSYNIDQEWLELVKEDVLEPEIPIVDPHHHLMSWPFNYELNDWLVELKSSGHNVVATVHTEAHGHYRKDGPEHLKPVGETEYLVKAVEEANNVPDTPRVMAGIVGGGEIQRGGTAVEELLDAHVAAAKGRFRGVRINLFWGFDRDGRMFPAPSWEDAVDRAELQDGVARLARRNLCLELVCHHPNLPHVARLARRVPEAVIVVNHLGTIMDRNPNPAPEAELIAAWRRGIDAIADQANIRLKLGGCANPMISYSMPAMRAFYKRAKPPTSAEIAEVYRPFVTYAIEKLGPQRCMFESNFPVDKTMVGYPILWNAFKRLAQSYSLDERRALLGGTAADVYRVEI
jgi:predicted TIM-barrel fold metal-dependent hydrolase